MKKNTLENLTQSKKKLMVKKLKDNLKWAKQKGMEEKTKLLRHQSPEESFKNFLVLSDFYCQVFLVWGEPRAIQEIDIVVLISKDRAFDFLTEAKKYGFSYQERRS